MLTRHFLKVLLIFTTLIAFGLLGVFLVTLFSKGKDNISQEGVVVTYENDIFAE